MTGTQSEFSLLKRGGQREGKEMALEGMSPGVIATIVVVTIIAIALLVFYFACRSDDPVRDHTCVALLYPRTRRELQQLRIPLDPVNPSDIGVNSGYQPDCEETKEHNVQVHTPPQTATLQHCSESTSNRTMEEAAPRQDTDVTVELKPAAAQAAATASE